ncbi:MAG: hypothetical protein JNM76_04910 [Betaproteobacteria bacterium]|nr:hypothetical protein [Betaproteobacteria bacterium]
MNARIKLILLFLLFASPFIVAWIVFHFWTPSSFTNRGTLVSPVIQLANIPIRIAAPEPAERKWSAEPRLHGKWVLLHVGAMPCDATCEARLVDMRQVHAALGKNQPRVQRAFAIQRGAADPAFAARVPDLIWLEGAELNAAVGKAMPSGAATGDMLLIIDPLGNLMLRHGPGVDLKGVVKDMERLLKASRIG